MTNEVLLVDDDALVREALGQTLELAGFAPVICGSYIEAKDHVSPDFDGVILTDIRMPGKDGFALLELAQKSDSDLPVILLTGEADVPMAVRGMSEGAFAFLEKPCDPDALTQAVERALKSRQLVMENRQLKHRLEEGDAAARMLFGHSDKAEALRARVRAVARADVEVLISAAPGSHAGKVAECMHLLSARAQAPFQKLRAFDLTEARLDEVLAQTEAGSLYIDGVATLGKPVQYHLLEHLDEAKGARIFVGTYRDLKGLVESGEFSEDLYYRVSVSEVRIPALKERPEDIPVLFRHYVDQAAEQAALPVPEITSERVSWLMAQDWPGNARALMNAAMRFVMGVQDVDAETPLGLAEQVAQYERSLLVEALRRHDGRAGAAAEALKLPRKTFYDKLARHGIRPEAFRG